MEPKKRGVRFFGGTNVGGKNWGNQKRMSLCPSKKTSRAACRHKKKTMGKGRKSDLLEQGGMVGRGYRGKRGDGRKSQDKTYATGLQILKNINRKNLQTPKGG